MLPTGLAVSPGPGIIETPRRIFSDFTPAHHALAPPLWTLRWRRVFRVEIKLHVKGRAPWASQWLLLVLPTEKANTILVVTVSQKRSLFVRHEGADGVGEPH
jgi:hypothetical protein